MTQIIVPAAGPVLRRALTVPLDAVAWRDSGDPNFPDVVTLRGHAAVFNSLSEDLGGFREMIAPGAFRAALRKQPDVRLLFNHDPSYVLGRTASGTLELREDNSGLHVFARVDRSISWANDLQRSMQRGDIDQMSFAFTVTDGGDTWAVAENGTVVRTINADGIDELFDTSVVTFPAYTMTTADMREILLRAVNDGRLPNSAGADNQVESFGAGMASTSSGASAGEDNEARRRLAALRAKSRSAVSTYISVKET